MTAILESELEAIGPGNLAVIVPDSLMAQVVDALRASAIEFGQIYERGLDSRITVVPVGFVKGLELDAAIVVEPARIVSSEKNGLKSLYVALTRATRRLAVLYAEPLPLDFGLNQHGVFVSGEYD